MILDFKLFWVFSQRLNTRRRSGYFPVLDISPASDTPIGGVVRLWGTNISLADTSVAGSVHLPFAYNALRGRCLPVSPSGFRYVARGVHSVCTDRRRKVLSCVCGWLLAIRVFGSAMGFLKKLMCWRNGNEKVRYKKYITKV
jgi:hypothetical protein